LWWLSVVRYGWTGAVKARWRRVVPTLAGARQGHDAVMALIRAGATGRQVAGLLAAHGSAGQDDLSVGA